MSSNSVINFVSTVALSSLGTLLIKVWLDKRAKSDERNYQIKQSVYVQVSKALQDFMSDGDERKTVDALHSLLAEAYIFAPDKVIIGIRKVWEDRDEKDDIRGKNVSDLIISLRKDMVPKTKLTHDDHFTFKFPD